MVLSESLLASIGACLAFLAALISLVGAIGMLRFPDFFSRLHPASLKDSLALPCLIVGLICVTGLELESAKLVLVLVFVLATGPAAAHALAHSALIVQHEAEADVVANETLNEALHLGRHERMQDSPGHRDGDAI